MNKALRTTMAAVLAAATLSLANAQPARADGAASTRNIILGAAALVAGVAIESNVARKHAQAGTVQGYLPDGAAVYADGHVTLPNGQSYYPGNYGQTVACNDGTCSLAGGNGNGYYGYASGNGYGYNRPFALNVNGGDNRNGGGNRNGQAHSRDER